MDIDRATPLLGGLTPRLFMRRHWQKKPLLVRGAIDPVEVDVTAEHLFDLAGRDDVRSRLVVHGETGWRLRHGPLARRALPSRKRAQWTLLVQAMTGTAPTCMHCSRAFGSCRRRGWTM